MKEQELSREESLQLITSMIQQAKRNAARGGVSFQFLLWGWVIALANFGHYFLDVFDLYYAPFHIWLITIPAAVLSFTYGFRKSKHATVRSHLDNIYFYLWMAIGSIIIIILVFMAKFNFNHNPIILLFTGLGTFVSGILIRFRPIIIGAIFLWLGACIGLLSTITDQQLIAGIAVVIGYLVPGYLLKKTENDSF